MPILSNWKLTFDPAGTPRVLLDFGQKMVQELRWPVRRGLEVVDIAEAAAPFLRVTGNAVVALSFEVFADEATDALSRRALRASHNGVKLLLVVVGSILLPTICQANCAGFRHDDLSC